MSLNPSNSDLLEQALESAPRNVRQLEIDACRIRTDLARLEVANAAGVAGEAAVANGEVVPPLRDDVSDASQPSPLSEQALASSPGLSDSENRVPIAASDTLDWQHAAVTGPEGINILVGAPLLADSQSQVVDSQSDAAEAGIVDTSFVAEMAAGLRGTNRRTTSPVMASVVLHGVILLLTFSVTVATIERVDRPFSTTVLDLNNEPPKALESLDDHQLRDLGEAVAQDLGSDAKPSNAVDVPITDSIPLDFNSIDGPVTLGAIGPPATITPDLGMLPAGGNGLEADGKGVPAGLGKGNQLGGGGGPVVAGGRKASGRFDTTMFFGTETRGNRFVFVVDNSSSMKGGRLEMAVAELNRTIASLSPRQSFYVIFVSDQTYPMFYPQREPALVAATPANKKRLADWAAKAILASGKNRELIKAMDMAASLHPQAVYLLWDGDLRYSEKVREDVMTHLTQPNSTWNFIVHTLGMGISSLDSEQNLTAIAQSHGGAFRRIDVPVARKR